MPTSRTSRTASSKPKLKLKWWYALPVILIVLIAGYAIVRFSRAGSEAGHHCFVRKADATLWCWGDNSNGQLGIGTYGGWQGAPKQVPIANVASVTTGAIHTCASKTDGTLWCWGGNGYGQLGIGNATQQNYPKQLFFNNTAQLKAGRYHTCASKTDGTLWCWGNNTYGQLGVGNTTQQNAPKQLFFANTFVVSAGANHTCATKTDLTLWCWGNNTSGQLGLGSYTTQTAPKQLYFSDRINNNIAQVSAGGDHTCTTKTDGTLYCWGSNSHGQLGIGPSNYYAGQKIDTTSQNYPRQLSYFNWAQVSAGSYYTCASKTDRTLWCWGWNLTGELGLGDQLPRYAPTQLFFANTAIIDSARTNTCASKTDGTVWCWGEGVNGKNGLGTDYNTKLVPTQLFLNVN